MNTDIIEYMTEDIGAHRVVFEKQVCPECRGEGTTWHGWGGADACTFTSSEWYDLDQDDRDGYMSGRYDQVCPECNGLRVVDVIDRDASDPEAVEWLDRYHDSMADMRAAERTERAMGA